MNDFRLGIAVLAILFVVVVWVYNKVQEWRLREPLAKHFETPGSDPLEAAVAGNAGNASERAEPSLQLYEGAVSPPRPGSVLEEYEAAASASELEETGQSLDERIHAIITLSFEEPVRGERLAADLPGMRYAGRQRVSLWGNESYIWAPLDPAKSYDLVAVAVQLANRSGPINEIEYSEFVAHLQQLAESLGATCDVPEMAESVQRARALDAQCAPLDAQIGITLANPRGYWSGHEIERAARELSMGLEGDGAFHAMRGDGRSLFTLNNAEGAGFHINQLHDLRTARLTFLLDVPLVAAELEPYARMCELAQALAQKLDGLLVDDQLRTLTPILLEGIMRQIEPVYARLEAAGVPAGSTRALALFS